MYVSTSLRVTDGESRVSPPRYRAHGVREPLGRGVLGQKAAGTGLERRIDVLVQIEGRQDQHSGAMRTDDLMRGLDSVHAGHAQIHQHDVGVLLATHPQRLQPGRRLPYDTDVGEVIEDGPEAAAYQSLIVNDQNTDRVRPPNDSSRRLGGRQHDLNGKAVVMTPGRKLAAEHRHSLLHAEQTMPA